jgi:L-amino acid N-acyltransferase YncA
MNAASIRPASADDIGAITRIYADAVTHGLATFEIEPPDEAEMARRRETLLASDYPYLVVERAGAIVGYAYAGPYHARPGYRFSVEDTIYVDTPFRRLGLGRLLLARLIAEAEARSFRQMVAVIGDSANVGSIAVHAAVGFRRIGTLQALGFKHGRWVDVVMMQRPLGGGHATAPGVSE